MGRKSLRQTFGEGTFIQNERALPLKMHVRQVSEKSDDMKLNELSYELKAKARQCESTDELVALAQKEGVELDLDQLDHVSGGMGGQ